MRENMGLYRGKRKDNGEWVEGGIVVNGDYVAIVQYSDYHGWHDFIEVIPETVGECSGLPDKNGKLIFEGDVCLCDRNIAPSVDERKFEIVFDVQQGEWFGEGWNSNIEAYQFGICEVIGNIHDNPELLEVRE